MDVEQETCVSTRRDHARASLALAVYEAPCRVMYLFSLRNSSAVFSLRLGDEGFK